MSDSGRSVNRRSGAPVYSAYRHPYLFDAMYSMQHLQPGGEFKDRYRFAWYESGHMMYLRKADLKNANDDLRSFIAWALEGVKDYPRKAR